MTEKSISIAFRGSDAYRLRLQRAALEREIKVQELIERALEAYLGTQPTRAEIPRAPAGFEALLVRSEFAPVVRALIAWLESEGKEQVLAALDSGLAGHAPVESVQHERAQLPGSSGQQPKTAKAPR